MKKKEDDTAPNHYNCPIVATYPEVIANNMDDVFEEAGVRFSHPFLPYDAGVEVLARELYNTLNISGASPDDIVRAVIAARDEDSRYHGDVRKAGEYALRYARANNKKVMMLGGRPYHIDPEINHGLDKLINSFDMVVLSEDSIAHLRDLKRPIRV